MDVPFVFISGPPPPRTEQGKCVDPKTQLILRLQGNVNGGGGGERILPHLPTLQSCAIDWFEMRLFS